MGAGAEDRHRVRAEKALTRRVAVTGLGIVSCLGNEAGAVGAALREGRSGLRFASAYERMGMRSRVSGEPSLEGEPQIGRKARRFMGEVAIFAHHALRKALADSGLPGTSIASPRTGLLVGTGVGSLSQYVPAVDALRAGGLRKMPPYVVPQTMASTASAALATAFGIEGVSYSISAACASSAHAIGQGAALIRSGVQDVVLAGGSEEAGWPTAAPFDAMGALSTAYNDRPQAASRPFDTGRDGFVMAGGAGMLVLEDLVAARRRGARIYAELAGYGASSGGDMINGSAKALAQAMRAAGAQSGVARIDYLNAHAIGSPSGDLAELRALREAFGAALPAVSSTKGLTGHSLGASGAQEAIYCLLMLEQNFAAGSCNLEDPDPGAAGVPLLREAQSRRLSAVMSNSFGFGGTNASLVLRRV